MCTAPSDAEDTALATSLERLLAICDPYPDVCPGCLGLPCDCDGDWIDPEEAP